MLELIIMHMKHGGKKIKVKRKHEIVDVRLAHQGDPYKIEQNFLIQVFSSTFNVI